MNYTKILTGSYTRLSALISNVQEVTQLRNEFNGNYRIQSIVNAANITANEEILLAQEILNSLVGSLGNGDYNHAFDDAELKVQDLEKERELVEELKSINSNRWYELDDVIEGVLEEAVEGLQKSVNEMLELINVLKLLWNLIVEDCCNSISLIKDSYISIYEYMSELSDNIYMLADNNEINSLENIEELTEAVAFFDQLED